MTQSEQLWWIGLLQWLEEHRHIALCSDIPTHKILVIYASMKPKNVQHTRGYRLYARLAIARRLCLTFSAIATGIVTGIAQRSYSQAWKDDHNATLSIQRDFGFNESTMKARIQQDLEHLVSYVRQLRGRSSDLQETLTLCVSNVMSSILWGQNPSPQ